jgi:hypothetical protein
MPLPDKIHAGISCSFSVTAPAAYGPGASYSLSLTLQSQEKKHDITATITGSGSTFDVEITAANTATLTAGFYTLFAVATLSADKRMVAQHPVQVVANVLGSSPVDTRSFNRRVLDSIRAVLEGRAKKSDLEVSVDGVSVKRMSLEDLGKAEDRYAVKVAREEDAERQKAGGVSRKNVFIKFSGV